MVTDFISVSKCRLILLRLLFEEFMKTVRIQLRRLALDRKKQDAIAFADGKKHIDLQLSSLKTGCIAVAGALSPVFFEALQQKAKEIRRMLREGIRRDTIDELLRKLLRSKRKTLVGVNTQLGEFRLPKPDIKTARALIQEDNDLLGAYFQSMENRALYKTGAVIPQPRQSLSLSLISSITADDLLAVLIRSYRSIP